MKGLLSREQAPITEDEVEEEEIPPQGSRHAWALANKPQMGLTLFSVKGNYRSPTYIHFVDLEGSGSRLTVYFTHMTVKIEGRGLEALAEGLRRQVIRYIQEQHKDVQFGQPGNEYVRSITVEKATEAEELGKWNG